MHKNTTIINDYYLEFNLEPQINGRKVEFTVNAVKDFPPEVVKKATDFYSGQDNRLKMPNVPVLVKKCKEVIAESKTEIRVLCDLCDGEGRILAIICVRCEDKILVNTYNHKILKHDRYYPSVTGRCKCINGEKFHKSIPNIVNPTNFVINQEGDRINLTNFEVQNWCTHFNGKVRVL